MPSIFDDELGPSQGGSSYFDDYSISHCFE
jgi:hypothetical protein